MTNAGVIPPVAESPFAAKFATPDRYQQSVRRTLLFLAAVIVALGCILFGTAIYIDTQLHKARINNLAEAGSLYIEGFLSNYARGIVAGDLPDAEQQQALRENLHQLSLGSKLDALVVWNREGGLLFSSTGAHAENVLGTAEFNMAAQGKVNAVEVMEGEIGHPHIVSPPFVEVYAPIRNRSTGEVIAIGEIYIDATGLLAEEQETGRTIWYAIITAYIGLVGLSMFIACQRFRLLRQLAKERRLLVQIRGLKQEADQSRIAASQSNEELLNLLGAEIHDGPIQMLSLLMLMNDKDDATVMKTAGMSRVKLTEQIMLDLRAISNGLILPEIRNLPLKEVLLLAVSRHEEMTGHKVHVDLGYMPRKVESSLAICLYRFIQEGLTNADRHTGSGAKVLTGYVRNGRIHMTVSDMGPTEETHPQTVHSHRGLGLQGIKNRLAAFGGEVELRENDIGGMDLALTVSVIPIILGGPHCHVPDISLCPVNSCQFGSGPR